MAISMAMERIPLATDADGVVRIGKTRVTLDTVVAAFDDGATAEEIAHQYRALQLADVYAVITYYLRQRPEVEAICVSGESKQMLYAGRTKFDLIRRACASGYWLVERSSHDQTGKARCDTYRCDLRNRAELSLPLPYWPKLCRPRSDDGFPFGAIMQG